MKTITRYQSEDGKIFTKKSDCLEYEKLLSEVNEFLKTFPNKDRWENELSMGKGYLQLTKTNKDSLEKTIVNLFNKYINPKEKFTSFGYVLGRYIDDGDIKCLNLLSYRLMCIDDTYKEWEQPYYANNPNPRAIKVN